MNTEDKLEMLADVFDVELEEITPESVLSEIEEWNSMSKLSLIVMFDDEFSKKIQSSDIKNFETVQDILDLME